MYIIFSDIVFMIYILHVQCISIYEQPTNLRMDTIIRPVLGLQMCSKAA